MTEELWLPVKGYEGLYEVSSLGDIRNTKRNLVKKQFVNPVNGYMQIQLSKEGVPNSYRVHKLVAEAFIGNPDNKKEVNHINSIRTDNRVENLEWSDRYANMLHAVESGSYVKQQVPVDVFDLNGNLLMSCDSIGEAARRIGAKRRNVSLAAINGHKCLLKYIIKHKITN